MLTTIINTLFDKGFLDADDILDLDEVYSIVTLTLPGRRPVAIEIYEDEETNLLHIRSKLGLIRNGAARPQNIALAYVASAKASEMLEASEKVGFVLIDATTNSIHFWHTCSFLIAEENPEYMAKVIINFSEGTLSVKPYFSQICCKAEVADLAVDDIFPSDDQKEIVVELHPSLRFAVLKTHQKESLSAFMLRENLTLERIDALFSGPTLEVYPVVCDKFVSLRLNSGNYCRTIAKIEIALGKSAMKEEIRKCHDFYLAVLAYLGFKASKEWMAYHSAEELIDEIEDMLATD